MCLFDYAESRHLAITNLQQTKEFWISDKQFLLFSILITPAEFFKLPPLNLGKAPLSTARLTGRLAQSILALIKIKNLPHMRDPATAGP
jgi:hypothetical protein